MTFRVLDCDGYPVRPLTPQDVSIINDEKGEPFGAGMEGGGASAPDIPSNFGLFTILALDMSDSIFNGGALNQMIDGAELFVQKAVVEPRPELRQKVGILVFGRTAEIRMVLQPTSDATTLIDTLEGLRTAQSLGTTNLYGAYIAAIDEVVNQGVGLELVERSVVILTDGTHEAGDEAAMRIQALASRDQAVADNFLSIFSIGIRGNYDEEKLRELASKTEYFVIAEDATQLGPIFTNVAQMVERVAHSNYVVGVCTPVELGNPTLTIDVQLDGANAAETVPYPTEQLNGDVVNCDENVLANPCLDRECGMGAIPGFSCGACQGATEYCNVDQGLCIDDCEGRECGDSPVAGYSCGYCSGAREFCSDGQCIDDCAGRICGPSPHGSDCGSCLGTTEYCTEAGQCVDDCLGRACGLSPGGWFDCGECAGPTDYCTPEGSCEDDCAGRECGPSPNGLECGICQLAGEHCNLSTGQCVSNLWWDSAFTVKYPIKIPAYPGLTEPKYFAIKLVLNEPEISYQDFMPDGGDVRFVDSDEATTLDYFIERWNLVGDTIVYVRALVSPVSENTIFLYGESSTAQVSTSNFGATFGPALYMFGSFNDEARDLSGNTSGGAISGAVHEMSDSQLTELVDGHYTFDGSGDWISYQVSNVPVGSSSFCLWVKYMGQNTRSFIYDSWDGVDTQIRLEINAQNNIHVDYYEGGVCAQVSGVQMFNDDQWHYVCVVDNLDGDLLQVWVDGNLDASTPNTCSGYSPQAPLYLGVSYALSYGFLGSLDEFRIYHDAISENDVQLLYRQPQVEILPRISQ